MDGWIGSYRQNRGIDRYFELDGGIDKRIPNELTSNNVVTIKGQGRVYP